MNRIKTLGLSCFALGAVAALSGCVEDGYGYGGGAVAAGYGPGYDGYYDGVYGSYGDPYYGAGYPGYYGWYGGYYYPGSGLYVYDRNRRPSRWTGDQRRYWHGQQHAYRGSVGAQGFRGSANWGGFERSNGAGARPTGQAFRGGAGGRGGGFHGGGGRHR